MLAEYCLYFEPFLDPLNFRLIQKEHLTRISKRFTKALASAGRGKGGSCNCPPKNIFEQN